MVIGSHNSWSYLKPKKWWMKLISFTSKCQDLHIIDQYYFGVRCFDLRIRFNKNGELVVAHGIIEYNITEQQLKNNLSWLNSRNNISVRILHEVRSKKKYTKTSIEKFREFCLYCVENYKNIKFWCGKNLYNWKEDYVFRYNPICLELYSSVCSPNIIDDWWPRLYALINNGKINTKNITQDILLLDFVNYKTDLYEH